jgi:hypothetical protein
MRATFALLAVRLEAFNGHGSRGWYPVLVGITFLAAGCVPRAGGVSPPPAPPEASADIAGSTCDPSLWAHVYHGRFDRPQERLQVIEQCLTVTGTIVSAVPEKDGDYHLRIDVDEKALLNSKNMSDQHGFLVVEPVCENAVSQRDTLEEGVCTTFRQAVFDPSMIGMRVSITGAYVTDMQHGWNEIHPVTSITPITSP